MSGVLRLPEADRRVAHGALLAQVDDVHVGGVYSWTAEQHDLASDLFGRLEAEAVEVLSPVESSALLKSLLFPVHDLDHPDMEQGEWAAAEAMLAALSAQWGR